jgi:hypothetical protein
MKRLRDELAKQLTRAADLDQKINQSLEKFGDV